MNMTLKLEILVVVSFVIVENKVMRVYNSLHAWILLVHFRGVFNLGLFNKKSGAFFEIQRVW